MTGIAGSNPKYAQGPFSSEIHGRQGQNGELTPRAICQHGLLEVRVNRVVGQPNVEQRFLEFRARDLPFETSVLVDNHAAFRDIYQIEDVSLGDGILEASPELADLLLDWSNLPTRGFLEPLRQRGHQFLLADKTRRNLNSDGHWFLGGNDVRGAATGLREIESRLIKLQKGFRARTPAIQDKTVLAGFEVLGKLRGVNVIAADSDEAGC